MTKFKTHKKKGAAAIVTASVLALIALFGMTACSNAAQPGTGTGGSTALPDAPFVEGGASLILSPDKLTIEVTAVTSDGSAIAVEGCTETTLASGNSTYTVLHAIGTTVILKGKITELNCGDYTYDGIQNKLTALNVQGLTALQRLVCSGNQLTALDVQGLTALQSLNCWKNQLTALDVQGLSALRELNCGGNQLTALDVQGLSALKELGCWGNSLTALDVQGLTALQRLVCSGNQLTTLNVQGLTALQYLNCGDNQLTALNVQGCTALKKLWCYSNQLTALDVQGLSALRELNCGGNQLTALDVQGLSALKELGCWGNSLTALNVQGLTALRWLDCGGNQLNADAFKKLFDDLPQRADSDNAKCILYTEESGVSEGNHTDFTAPSDLVDAFNNVKTVKKWKMYKYNAGWHMVEL